MKINHFVNYGTVNEVNKGAVQNIYNNNCGVNTAVINKDNATHSADAKLPTIDILHSEKAMQLWHKAQQMQWIDSNLQPLISNQKAAILASVMADELKLSPRWEPFEKLWNIKNMPNCLCKAQDCSYYAPFMKSVEAALL
jgi:hypothetical protein